MVDLLYFADLLEHLPDPLGFLKDLSGFKHVVMLIPIESGLLADLFYFYRRLLGKPTSYEIYGHLHRFTRRKILKLLQKAGLAIREIKVIPVPMKPTGAITLKGKLVTLLTRVVAKISPRLEEILFGNRVLVVYCTNLGIEQR